MGRRKKLTWENLGDKKINFPRHFSKAEFEGVVEKVLVWNEEEEACAESLDGWNRYSINDYVTQNTSLSYKTKFRKKCVECFKRFRVKDRYNEHLIFHDNVHPHLCKMCFFSFDTDRNFKLHKELLGYSNLYPCEWCYQVFYFPHNLQRHMETHISRLHKCVICYSAFSTVVEKSKQSSYHFLSCELCGIFFNNPFEHYNHAVTVHEYREREKAQLLQILSSKDSSDDDSEEKEKKASRPMLSTSMISAFNFPHRKNYCKEEFHAFDPVDVRRNSVKTMYLPITRLKFKKPRKKQVRVKSFRYKIVDGNNNVKKQWVKQEFEHDEKYTMPKYIPPPKSAMKEKNKPQRMEDKTAIENRMRAELIELDKEIDKRKSLAIYWFMDVIDHYIALAERRQNICVTVHELRWQTEEELNNQVQLIVSLVSQFRPDFTTLIKSEPQRRRGALKLYYLTKVLNKK